MRTSRCLTLLPSALLLALLLAGCEAAPPTVPVVDFAMRSTPTAVAPTSTPAPAPTGESDPTPTAYPAPTLTPLHSPRPTAPPATPTATSEAAAAPTPVPVSPTSTPTPDAGPAPTATPTPVTTLVPGFDAEEYFSSGADIIVTHNPGGMTDSYARLVSRHLPEYLPGSPRVVVRNWTKPFVSRLEDFVLYPNQDIEVFATGSVDFKKLLAGHIRSELMNIDLGMLKVLHGLSSDSTVAEVTSTQAAWAFRDYATTWDEVQRKNEAPISGIIDYSGLDSVAALILGEFMNITERRFDDELRYIHAHNQGLIDLSNYSLSAIRDAFPEWIENGYIVPLFYWGMDPANDQEFTDYVVGTLGFDMPPHLSDVAGLNEKQRDMFLLTEILETHEAERLISDEQRAAFGINTAFDAAFRSLFYMPPGTPDHIYEVWLGAFSGLSRDSAFVEEVKSGWYSTGESMTPEQIQQLFTTAEQAFQNPVTSAAFEVLSGLVDLENFDDFRAFQRLE